MPKVVRASTCSWLFIRERLLRVLRRLFDENEFLSPFGIRSLSRAHKDSPYVLQVGGQEHRVQYVPGESDSALFGGNSNWRGPIWFPINYLLIEAIERYHHFYGDSLRVEFPTGSGQSMTLNAIAYHLSRRLADLFRIDRSTSRPRNNGGRMGTPTSMETLSCSSTSTSTAITVAAWAPAAIQDGPHLSSTASRQPPA